MALSRFACSLLMLVLVSSALQFPGASAQESNSGPRFTIEVTFEHSGTDADPYFFQTITAVVAPDANIPGMFTGNGTGTWQWRDPQTSECPPYSGNGAFPAMISGLIGEVQTAEGKEYSVGLQATPGRSLAEAEDFEKYYSVTCHSPPDYVFDEDRSSGPVPLLPQVTLKSNASRWYGEEIGFQTDCCFSKMTVTLSPPEVKYRIFGTVKDIRGALPESKLVLGDLDTISGGALPIQMLSSSTPDFEDEATASKDSGEYEFEVERPLGATPEFVVVSLLWYDGDGEFAVTNGPPVGGRTIPVYQAACVSDTKDYCIEWEQTGDGFEAEVDIQYGFASFEKHSQIIGIEQWHAGSGGMAVMIRDAAKIYYESYRAMKYFESKKGEVGMPLNPVTMDIYNSRDSHCRDNSGNDKDNAFFDYQAQSPFGELGSHLEQTEAKGGTVTICTKTSSSGQWDAPINREWHELGHYLQSDMYTGTNLAQGRGTPHDGYKNTSTNDSFVEGFASFVAMLIAEFHNELQGGQPIYPGHANLEEDYKVWGRNVAIFMYEDGRIVPRYAPNIRSDEEWAVAGLLWDMHDSGRETHTKHKAGVNEDLSDLWVELSEVYHTTEDRMALFDGHILGNIRSDKPMNLVDLYSAFLGDVSAGDLDMIFINHGAFGDVESRNLIHNVTEAIGATGSTQEPARPGRMSPQPTLPGSYFAAERNATFAVNIVHEEPYSNYDYSYRVNMTVDQPRYFEMPPPYYPSKAVFDQISSDGKILNANALVINSSEYWSYIDSNPETNAIFKTLPVSENPPEIPDNGSEPAPQSPTPPSGCLIATAAFGSELTPHVQFLRGFRDNHILSTASGSSFMTAFNSWYYSFSPQVADYERQQPWLQGSLRVAIYPLLGILQTAEKAYTTVPGEYGSIAAGLVASSLIGAVYFSPIALSIKQVRKNRLDYRLALGIIAAFAGSVVLALIANNSQALMITTSLLVLSTLGIVAIYTAKVIWKIFRLCRNSG